MTIRHGMGSAMHWHDTDEMTKVIGFDCYRCVTCLGNGLQPFHPVSDDCWSDGPEWCGLARQHEPHFYGMHKPASTVRPWCLGLVPFEFADGGRKPCTCGARYQPLHRLGHDRTLDMLALEHWEDIDGERAVCVWVRDGNVIHHFDGQPCMGEIELDAVREHMGDAAHEALNRVLTDDVTQRGCRYCGCTDDSACPGGCSWVSDDVCSSCLEKSGTAGREVDASVANAHGMVWSSTYAPGDDLSKPSVRGKWVNAPPPTAAHYAGEPVGSIRLDDAVYTITSVRRRGLEIQVEPWHYRWADFGRAHNPRRCILCRLERLTVRLGLAHYAHYAPDGPDGPDDPADDSWYQSWPMHNLVAHPLGELLHLLGRIWGGDDDLGNRLHDATLPTHEEGTGRG